MSSLRGTEYYYHLVLKRIPPRARPPFEDQDMQQRVWGRWWGVYNDVGTLRMCLLHRPGDELNVMTEDKYDPSIEALIDDRDQWYFRSDSPPDIPRMQEEHDALAGILEDHGVELVYVDGSPRNPNAMFVRDVAMIVPGGAIIGRTGPVGYEHGTGRRGEERYVTQKLAELGMPILRTVHGEGLMEGGSFCLLNEGHAVVGTSYRQNAAGVDQVRNVLEHLNIQLIELPLVGHSLHLDGCVVMVDHDKALIDINRIAYWFLDKLAQLGIQTIEVDPRDRGKVVNCLAIAPGKVVMCQEGSDWTADRLDRAGVEVTQTPFEEISKNGGGIHCSTLPLVRDAD